MPATPLPTPGAEAGLALERLRLLAAGADVGGEAEPGGQLVHLGEVVALVQAEPLRPLGCRLGALDRDRGDRRPGELEVVQIGSRRPGRSHGEERNPPSRVPFLIFGKPISLSSVSPGRHSVDSSCCLRGEPSSYSRFVFLALQ
jgi:hypothetical protein